MGMRHEQARNIGPTPNRQLPGPRVEKSKPLSCVATWREQTNRRLRAAAAYQQLAQQVEGVLKA